MTIKTRKLGKFTVIVVVGQPEGKGKIKGMKLGFFISPCPICQQTSHVYVLDKGLKLLQRLIFREQPSCM
jgi:hypothetical protein